MVSYNPKYLKEVKKCGCRVFEHSQNSDKLRIELCERHQKKGRGTTMVKNLVLAVVVATHMMNYVDNAILGAAEHGEKKVLLVFGNAPTEQVESVADNLRKRGYVIDEQAAVLNPRVIKVLRLKVRS